MRFQSLFLILLVLFASTATNQALNISDPHMIDIANFAVTEHNKQITEAKLKFEKIIEGLSFNVRDKALNISDPHVIDIANFAVTEHNKQITEAKLMFEKIIEGLSFNVRDKTYYLLSIFANNGSTSNNYITVVIEKPLNHFYLRFFHIVPQ